MKKGVLLLAMLLLFSCLSPALGAWVDVPYDAWYADAAAWCVRANLLRSAPNGSFRPDAGVTKGEVQDALTMAVDRLLGGSGVLDAPDSWGVAKISDERGIPLLTFRAWESDWRAWNGLSGTERYHYLIAATTEQLLAIFPAADSAAASGAMTYAATLDMGDLVLSGTLCGLPDGGSVFGEDSPAFLFYPDSVVKSTGSTEAPFAPSELFLSALQNGAENRDRLYGFLAAGADTQPLTLDTSGEAADRRYLAELLNLLRKGTALPEDTFAPRFERSIPESEAAYRELLAPLYEAGLLLGVDEEGYYAPEEPLTRAQFAVVLYRLLNPEQRGV